MNKTFSIISLRREWVFDMPAADSQHVFLSDSHHDHANIIKYSSRPFMSDEEKDMHAKKIRFKPSFESVKRMNRVMIDRTNEVARPQDILWHLGDVSWHGEIKAKEYFDALNCKNVILIMGNHDEPEFADLIPLQMARPRYGKLLRPGQLIRPVYDQCFAIVDGQSMHFNHYPHDSWEASHKGVWHLYGHVHGAKNNRHQDFPGWSLSVDVGVDSHNFYPWTMKELRELFAKRYPTWKAERDKMKDKEDGGMTPVNPHERL